MKDFSKELISRLPRYLRYFGEYVNLNLEKISSADLARRLGVTASQIRSDFSHFAFSGQQGYGYNVKQAYEEIKKVLGLYEEKKVILIGVGNIGKALVNHKMFHNRGFKLIAVFDKYLQGKAGEFQIRHIDEVDEFVKQNKTDIAILAVPSNASNEVAMRIVDLGIKGILNFCYTDLNVPDGVVVENIHIRDHLMTLSYKMGEENKA